MWVVTQPFIDLAVKWRLLASLLLVVTWLTLSAKLPDGGEEERRRYEKEQEDNHKRHVERRTAELFKSRYGFDPRGTMPWVGGLSAADVERYTLDQMKRALATYQLPAGMSMPSLTLRDWRPSTPVEARKALLLLAPWADNVPEEPEDSDVRSVDESPTETRARQQSRVRHMVEMMSFYETAWAHAWSEYEDQHGSLGFDPLSSAPWEGPARSTDLEETIEAGEDPVLPELVLREPAEDWPTAARDLIDRIVDNGDLPASPPPSYPAF